MTEIWVDNCCCKTYNSLYAKKVLTCCTKRFTLPFCTCCVIFFEGLNNFTVHSILIDLDTFSLWRCGCVPEYMRDLKLFSVFKESEIVFGHELYLWNKLHIFRPRAVIYFHHFEYLTNTFYFNCFFPHTFIGSRLHSIFSLIHPFLNSRHLSFSV